LTQRTVAIQKQFDEVAKASRYRHLLEDNAFKKARARVKDGPDGMLATLDNPMADDKDEEDDGKTCEAKRRKAGAVGGADDECPAGGEDTDSDDRFALVAVVSSRRFSGGFKSQPKRARWTGDEIGEKKPV
jgi:hypothetical protein